MSEHDDDAAKTSRRPSIPAPATVPRPSRPPGVAASPPAGSKAIPISAPPPGTSTAPPSDRRGRKGTLDGVPPAPAAPRDLYPAGGVAAPEEDFDAEKTMVVDPDDAPTADYDPRTQGSPYDPRARGTFSNAEPVQVTEAVPEPRASEAGKRRTSRRTVKIPDDQPKKKADGAAGADLPTDPHATPRDPSIAAAVAERAPEFNDEITDEITIVKPLRIISVGSDPPPPIRSALATWPPPPAPQVLEAGWTPATPPVELRVPAAPSVKDEDVPTPVAPPVREAPTVEVSEGDRVSEIALDRDEDLEEIEPDAAAIPQRTPPPKKPPPPPPKSTTKETPGKEAKADEKKEPKPAEEAAKKAARPWWDDIFSDEYLRTHDRADEKLIRREVDFIEESLGVEKHAVVLDLACGPGDHAIELAARGYNVVGVDYSEGMLALADKANKARQKATAGVRQPTFVRGDMRELGDEEAFDGAYVWSTSFGYFDEEKNLNVLARLHKALRQGGMLLLDVVNRDYVAPRSPSLVWFEGAQCVCMDDMYVDFFTSRLRVKRTAMFEGGLSRELEYSIRLYSLHELGKMLHEVGFKVVEVTGHPAHPGVFFGTESPRLIVLAERS
ncbi:MAG TPA: methyltransferase domain-containing protein [Polyangiaceae bacterium]|nr:methyltransferase domain-containing protein [Polyangiaceae bacterium]